MSEATISTAHTKETLLTVNTDCGEFIFGDGVFTTLKFANNLPLEIDAHLERLSSDAHRIAIEFPERFYILNQISLHIRQFKHPEGVIRIALVRSMRSIQSVNKNELDNCELFINCRKLSHWPEQINAVVCTQRLSRNPALAGIKHLSRLDLILATRELQLQQAEFQEGIVLDTENFVIEGLISNIFWFKRGAFFTPLVNSAGVNGLTRRRIIKILTSSQYSLNIGEFTLHDLLSSEHVWVCNSVRGIQPLSRINEQQFAKNNSLNSLLEKAIADDD